LRDTAVCFALAGVAVIGRAAGRGAVYAVLIFGAADLLPGVATTTTRIAGGYFLSDFAVYALVGLLLIDQATTGFSAFRRCLFLGRLTALSALLAVLWVAEVLRSWVADAIPLGHALSFAEYVPYFAVVTPLLCASLFDPAVRRGLVTVAVGWTVLMLGATVYANTHAGALSSLLHQVTQLSDFGSFTVERTFAASPDALALLAIPFGLGALLLGRSGTCRCCGALVATLAIAADATSLTRALYIGVMVATCGPVIVWFAIADSRHGFRRRVGTSVLAIAVVAALLVLIQPPAVSGSSAASTVVTSRLASIPEALLDQEALSSTVAYREYEAHLLEGYLGSDWVFGLGLLDPRDRYFVGLPSWDAGSILDTDVGVLNTVMILGVVGAVLQFAPALFVAVVLMLRQVTTRRVRDDEWMAFGGVGAVMGLCVTAATLTVFFSASTVVLCAAAIALGASVIADPQGPGRLKTQ
jgi:hypothetical protein